MEIKPYKYKGSVSLKDNTGHLYTTNVYGNEFESVMSECCDIYSHIQDQHPELEYNEVSVSDNF